jgi:hypothetical protein
MRFPGKRGRVSSVRSRRAQAAGSRGSGDSSRSRSSGLELVDAVDSARCPRDGSGSCVGTELVARQRCLRVAKENAHAQMKHRCCQRTVCNLAHTRNESCWGRRLEQLVGQQEHTVMTGVAVAQRQGGRHLSRWLLRCVKVFARATASFSNTHPRWGVHGPPSTGGCFCKPPVSAILLSTVW